MNPFDAIGPNDGSTTGNVVFGAGRVGRGFVFDGASQVAVPTTNGEFSLADRSFTIDAWVNFTQLIPRSPLIAHDDGGGEERKWIFWYDEVGNNAPSLPALRFHINGPDVGPQDPIYAAWSPVLGTWYHIAVTRELVGNNLDPTSNYALYINGSQVATATSSAVLDDAFGPLTIGQAEGLATPGAIDEVDVFDRALDPSEIAAIYNAGSAGKCLPTPAVVRSSVLGLVPGSGQAVCTNVTTSQSVTIPVPGGPRTFDCLGAGLAVNAGDRVQIKLSVTGKVQ